MLNIIIVDDEPKVLRGLRTIIDRSGEEWNITGEFKNGVEALAAIINEEPDVVITDIKMPCMDGLELVERAKDIAPNLKFIILSGFPDFSYAQKAIRLETVDYILKPPDYKDIIKSLKKTEEQLNERKTIIEEQSELKNLKEDSLIQLKDKFFAEMIYASASSKTECDDTEYECFCKPFVLFIIKLDNIPFSVFDDSTDMTAVLFEFRREIQNVIYNRGGCIVDLYDGSFCCLLNINHTSAVYLKGLAREIQQEISVPKGSDFTIGLSKCYDNPYQINTAFKECLYILKHRVFYEKNSILLLTEMHIENCSEEYPIDIEHKYIESLRFGDYEKAIVFLAELVDKVMLISNMNAATYKSYIMEFIIMVMRNLFDDRIIDKIKLPSTNEIFSKLNMLDNKSDLKELLITYTGTIADYFNEKNKPGCRKVINEIKSYISINYFNDISLRQISKDFFMNESYLSDLFKKETGYSFSSYLSNVRIDQSKVLLAQVDLKIQDIAEMVGYNDSRYFIKVFRKITKMTPTEYRERILNHG